MIVTERLKIYAAGEAEMKAFIARETAVPGTLYKNYINLI